MSARTPTVDAITLVRRYGALRAEGRYAEARTVLYRLEHMAKRPTRIWEDKEEPRIKGRRGVK